MNEADGGLTKRQKKRLRRQEQNAKKVIGDATATTGAKQVPQVVAPVAIDSKPFRWAADQIDHEHVGQWDWRLAPKEARDLLDLLAQMSGMTWAEVKNLKTNSKSRTRQLHHYQDLGSLCAAAQRRFEELEIQTEEVFRLRHGNLCRIWGYEDNAIFRIVWYDRGHKVCPTDE